MGSATATTRRPVASVDDAAASQVVRGHFDGYGVSRGDANPKLAHASRDVSEDEVAVFKFHFEHGVREGLPNDGF